jgi:hypothetical protein
MLIDYHKHNNNMLKDVMPFPNQDQIWLDVTGAKVWLKIDLSNTYE